MRRIITAAFCFALFQQHACTRESTSVAHVDLVIRNAMVLDVVEGRVRSNSTVVVDDGSIIDVLAEEVVPPSATRTIDARGRLLTPGLIDVHHHTEYVLGDSITSGGGFVADLTMQPDSITTYREWFARAYLPHGVTTVRDAGSSEDNMPMLLAWMIRSPQAPDFYPVGGAIVSHEEGRVPFAGHTVVRGPADAAQKVRDYHRQGIRHIKVYWRLREPELKAVIDEARSLGLNVTAHIDFKVLPRDLDLALDLGLTSFEHAYTIGVAALTPEQFEEVWRVHVPATIGDRREGRFYLGVMEYFNFLGSENERIIALIDRMAALDCTLTPTLHIFAQHLGLTSFTSPSVGDFDDLSGLSPAQRGRAVDGYRSMASYVKRMHDAGIVLAIGSDWLDPGQAVLSEMTLLNDAGIPMLEVFRIATLNGARAIGVDDQLGAIDVGKWANLVLFEGDPLNEPADLFRAKTVIKDGVVYDIDDPK